MGLQTGNRAGVATLLGDISMSLLRPGTWLRLGIRDVVLQYSRAGLGVAWSLLNVVVWVVVVTVFLGPSLSQDEPFYLTYVATGVVVFNFMSGILGGGTSVLVRLKGALLNLPLPLFACALRHVTQTFFHLVIQSIVIIAAMMIDGVPVTILVWLIVPAIAALVLVAVFVTSGLMVLGARYGDLAFLIQSVMRVMLFATPVFWYAGRIEGSLRYTLSMWNPLAHVLEVVRAPMLGEVPDVISIYVVVGLMAASALLGGGLFVVMRSRVRRWL